MNHRIRRITMNRPAAAAKLIDVYTSPAWLVRIADFIRLFFSPGQAPIDEKYY